MSTHKEKLKAIKMSKMVMPDLGFVDADGTPVGSAEYKLKKIIQAQVKGGAKYNGGWVDYLNDLDEPERQLGENLGFILEILLDTEGAKAAYGRAENKEVGYRIEIREGWELSVHEILHAWNSKGGNNYKEAINTAYNLLPAS
jgi:hypothetical protein